MKNKITVNLYGIDGQGETVKKAKQNIYSQIESLISDLQDSPWVYSQGGYTLIVFRDATRWGYTFTTPDQKGRRTYSVGCGDNKTDALRDARRHFASVLHDANLDWKDMVGSQSEVFYMTDYFESQQKFAEELKAQGRH